MLGGQTTSYVVAVHHAWRMASASAEGGTGHHVHEYRGGGSGAC